MSCCLVWLQGRAVIARWRLCWGLNARLGREEALGERGQENQLVWLLVVLGI